MTKSTEGWVQRILLPGLAFKAAVIGGGYATGRELVTYFLPSGPFGGLFAMALATIIWSAVCAVTFLFAFQHRSLDYRSFFKQLLGPFWRLFEFGYMLALIVVLAVFSAAAGSIGENLFGWPALIGAMCLMAGITLVTAWGNEAVEKLFKYVSFLLYGTYLIFTVLAFSQYGDRISAGFAHAQPTKDWAVNGLTYAGYNIIGAIVILPATRHLISRKDALVSGLLAGPLAMLPALFFYVCMVAYFPQILDETLPSDFLLERLDLPWFRILFQVMVFCALLESGAGGVHAINERISESYIESQGRAFPLKMRLILTLAILTLSVFGAGKFGLVALIADGLRWLSYLFLTIYVLPLMTFGMWRIVFRHPIRGPAVPAQQGQDLPVPKPQKSNQEMMR